MFFQKQRVLFYFKKKYKIKKRLFFKKIHLYPDSKTFAPQIEKYENFLIYDAFRLETRIFKKKFFNFKYRALIKLIGSVRHKRTEAFFVQHVWVSSKNITKIIITHYLKLYTFFFYRIFTDIYQYNRLRLKKINKFIYHIFLTFIKNRIFLNLLTLRKLKNYLFLSNGLFLKYFSKKKSVKKNKTIKLLIAKYMRKIFLILKIKNLILVVKKNPTFLLEFLNGINSPILHKFFNPLDDNLYEDKKKKNSQIKFLYFIFYKNQSFSFQKTVSQGRVKRKITRKLILKNTLID